MHAPNSPANDRAIALTAEELLLRRVAQGDAVAFRELVQILARPALSLATRIMGESSAAEDVVQEAFARLWREAARFDPGRGYFAGWWRRMLVNIALDGKRRIRPVAPLDDAIEVADASPDPQQQAEGADIAARVQAAAACLPPRQRAALAMFYGERLSMAEIAEILGSSEKAVEGLLLRARAELKTQLVGLKDDLK